MKSIYRARETHCGFLNAISGANAIKKITFLFMIITTETLSAPLTNGYALPMPNQFWPYNTTTLQTGTALQQNNPINNPDVYCEQEGYRLPSFGDYSTQYRSSNPYVHTPGLNLKGHWSTYVNNDITKEKLPNTVAGQRLIGAGLIEEWGNLSNYARVVPGHGNYVNGWNQSEFWVTELSSYFSGTPRRYTITNVAGHNHVIPTESRGVACVFDLVPTPANTKS